MNYIKRPFAVLAISLLILSCGGDKNLAGVGGNNASGNITIAVGSGTTPQYSWSGGNVFSISLVRTSAPATIVWGVATPGADNIASPIAQGTVPGGAIQTSATEATLTAGVEYRVTVARINGSDFGFKDFTP